MKRSTSIILTAGIIASSAFAFHVSAAKGIVVPDRRCWDEYNVQGTVRLGVLAPAGMKANDCRPADGCFYTYRASDGGRERLYVPYRTKPRISCPSALVQAAPSAPATTAPSPGTTPTTAAPTAPAPIPSTVAPTTPAPTTPVATIAPAPTTAAPSTAAPTTAAPTTVAPTTAAPSTVAPSTVAPTTVAPTTVAPTTVAPTTVAPTTVAPTTAAPTTAAPTTVAPPTAPAPRPAPTNGFAETFTNGTGLDRFDTGIYHRDEFVMRTSTWTGDHDMNCGSPDTQRTINRNSPSESFYTCRDHLMTSIGDTAGYSTGWFTPKQTFAGVRRVSWDVNVTDLGARKWWEVSVVPASFNSGVPSCQYCTVIDWLSPSPSGLPAYPKDAVVVGVGPFGKTFNVHANGTNFNPAGWQKTCGDAYALDPEGCASKAIRRTFVLTDNGNGTLTLNAFGQTYTFAGAFPAGEVKVVFKDHNYTPDKDGVPVGHTWHWDNIIVQ